MPPFAFAAALPFGVLDRQAPRIAGALVPGAVLVVLDTTVMNVVIGPLSRSMDVSLPVIQWVATGYTLAMAAVMPVQAWAVGRLGTPRVCYAAVGLFVIGSLIAGAAWDVQALIGARVVRGLGGGLVTPTVMTIALRAADPDTRGRIMAILGVPVLIGPVLGPVLGGWVIDAVSWRWVFLINPPLGLLAILVARRVLIRVTRPKRSTTHRRARGRRLQPPRRRVGSDRSWARGQR